MSDSVYYNNIQPRARPTSASRRVVMSSSSTCYTRFVRKFLLLAFFIFALPFFPSKAPDFMDNKSILTNNFWELLHLLFIGVAVSYGLSNRRNLTQFDQNVETQAHSQSQLYDSHTYYASNLFNNIDNACENPYGYAYGYGSESVVKGSYCGLNGYAYAMPRLGSFANEYGNPSVGVQDHNVVQAWNSQYFQGESMVMVANGNCVVDEYRAPGSMMGYSPLGLPVRSLKIRVENPEIHELNDGVSVESASSSSSSSGSSPSRELGDFGKAQNLEGSFQETVVKPSPVPWRSRSVRMGMRENVGVAAQPSHFRPFSVDDMQFESLKSRSFRHSASFPSLENATGPAEIGVNADFASQPSHFTPPLVDEPHSESFSDSFRSTGSSSSQGSFTHSQAVSLEMLNPNMEEMKRQRSFRQTYPPTSMSAAATNNSKVQLSEGEGTSTHPPDFWSFSADDTQFESLISESSQSMGSCTNPPQVIPLSVDDETQFDLLKSEPSRSIGTPHSAHFRPQSVDETQFESLKSESSRSKGPSSSTSHCSSPSYSPSRLSPSHTSIESANLQAAALQNEMSALGAHLTPSTSAALPNRKPPINYLHSRHYSMLEKDMQLSFEDRSKDSTWGKAKDLLSAKIQGSSSLKWNSKPAATGKASSRGKSVRTIRPRKHAGEVMRAGDTNEALFERKGEMTRHAQAVVNEGNMGDSDPRSGRIDDNVFVCSSKQKRDDYSPPKPPMPDHRRREKQEYTVNSVIRSKGYSESEAGNFDANSGSRSGKFDDNVFISSSKQKTDDYSPPKLTMLGHQRREKQEYSQNSVERFKDNSESDAGNSVANSDMISQRIDDNVFISSSKQKMDNRSPPKPTMPNHQSREKQEYVEYFVMRSKENSESETGNFEVNSDEEKAASDIMSESGHGPNEVDKKASEFIAKFREQIRLQKVSSIDSTRGLEISNHLFR